MILKKIKQLQGNSFLKNVALLFSGHVLSQALLFLFSPLLSRIYSADDFGNFSNFNAWVLILAVFSNWRYEQALVIAKNRIDSYKILNLTLFLTFVAFLFFTVLIFLLPLLPEIKYVTQIESILPYLSVGALVLCFNSVFIQYNIKYANFKVYAFISLVQVIAVLIVQILLGYFKNGDGLIIGTMAGHLVSGAILAIFYLRKNSLRYNIKLFTLQELKATALKHIDFPKYTTPTDLVNVIIQQFLPVLLLAYFDPKIAGLYFFSTRIIKTPVIVFTASFGTVLRQKAAELFIKGEAITGLYLRTLKNLVFISVVPFLLLYIYGEEFFVLFFGEEWKEAGKIITILTPGIFVEFIAMPLSVLFLVTNHQKYNLVIQSAGFVCLATAIIIGKEVFEDFTLTCYLISGITVCLNLISILLTRRVVNKVG